MQMKFKQAVTLAIQALEEQRHGLAVEANLADKFGATYPAAVNASAKRKKINEAIEVFNQELEELNCVDLLQSRILQHRRKGRTGDAAGALADQG
jgi:hypothetical protein